MPQIPVVNPSQRIDPSAPVQIASTSESGLDTRMGAALGEAIFALGDMLDRDNKARDSRDRQLQMQLYAEEVEAIARAESNRLASLASDPTDLDGNGTVKLFRDKVKEESDKLRGKYRPDIGTELDLAFAKVTNQYAGVVYATESDKREKDLGRKFQGLISSYTQEAIKNPNSVDENLLKGQKAILDSNMIAPALKEQQLLKFNKDIYKAAIIGKLDLSKSVIGETEAEYNKGLAQFSEAESIARTKFAAFATPEEVDKQLDDISRARTAWVAEENSIADARRKNAELLKKEANDLAEKKYIALITQAGNKTDVLDKLRKEFNSNPDFRDLPASTQEKLLKINFSKDLDDKYELQFKERMIFGTQADKYNILRNEVVRDSRGKDAKVSVEKAGDLLTMLDKDKERNKTTPEVQQYINQRARELKARFSTKTIDRNGKELLADSIAGEQVASIFRRKIAEEYADGSITLGQIDSIFKTVGGPFPNTINNVEPGTAMDKTKLPDAILQTVRKLKTDKSLTPDQRRSLLKSAKGMQENLNILNNIEKVKIRSEKEPSKQPETFLNK